MGSHAVPETQTPDVISSEPESSKKEKETEKDKEVSQKSSQPSTSSTPQPSSSPSPISRVQKPRVPHLDGLLKAISNPDFRFIFSTTAMSPGDLEVVTHFPQMLDPNGGAKRRAMKDKEKELEHQRQEAETQAALQAASTTEPEENPEGGSLQLGGEPEETQETGGGHGQQLAIAPPSQHNLGVGLGFRQNSSLADDFANLGISSRGLTAQQQQQLLLFKGAAPQSSALLSAFQGNQGQQQSHILQTSASGHARHTSRFKTLKVVACSLEGSLKRRKRQVVVTVSSLP